MVLVIDCNNLGYASAYATGDLTYEAKPTGVLFGFLSQIYKLAEYFGCGRFVFCWDSRKSYRKKAYPSYKEHRRKDLTSEEWDNLRKVYEQFDLLRKEVLPQMGFSNVFHQAGYEADDLIAHVVQRFPDEYIIVSTDNDLWQLIDKGRKGKTFVKVFNPRTKKLIGYKEFVASWGIEPYKWAEIKAIAGCPSDGIEGVKGVGEATAVKYVLGTLLKGKIRERIESSQEIIRRNRPLVTLPYAGVRPINIEKLEWPQMWTLDFMDVFGRYGFGSFLKEERFEKWAELFGLERGRKEDGERERKRLRKGTV